MLGASRPYFMDNQMNLLLLIRSKTLKIFRKGLGFVLMVGAIICTLTACADAIEQPATNCSQENCPDNAITYEVKPNKNPSHAITRKDNYSRYDIYTPYELTADLSHLSDNQKKMLGLLIEAADIMDDLFWQQTFGRKEMLLTGLPDEKAKKFAEINYGPWDRLDGNKPFIHAYQEKNPGAKFYPEDMSKEEFEQWDNKKKKNMYSIVRRLDLKSLEVIPYSTAYYEELHEARRLLLKASLLAENQQFQEYLQILAESLVSDYYRGSDMLWMDMKNNQIDLVYGPIETYEDQLFGYRAAFSAYVLVKDMAWSKKLEKFKNFLPELQKNLPVAKKYKQDMPGTNSQLNAYDVIYYAGDSNAGAKTIAINLPNDEVVQKEKGSRRLQLKNAMRAKFDKILLPLSEVLIEPKQRQHISFNAFFENTMFHEVAHGLGIKHTVNGKGLVRTALKETASALEEGKADILGLYMVIELSKKGEIESKNLMDNYVTFLASIFRSVRFGASSAHGKANMIRFNYFKQAGAFKRDEKSGYYSVDFDKMTQAINSLSEKILTIQGEGDYTAAKTLLEKQGVIGKTLADDLKRLEKAQIPVDIDFIQGKKVLGLK